MLPESDYNNEVPQQIVPELPDVAPLPPEQLRKPNFTDAVHDANETFLNTLALHPNLQLLLQVLAIAAGAYFSLQVFTAPEVAQRNWAVFGVLASAVLGLKTIDPAIEQKRQK